MRVTLSCHPDTPCAALSGIEVQVKREGALLDLHYFAHGDVEAVRWAEAVAPERAERLWEASCFEVFVRAAGRAPYCEFNFAPSTQWAAYRFTEYRAGMEWLMGIPAPMATTRMTGKVRVHHVRLALDGARGLATDADWQLALSAVIEESDGRKSYWALRHPEGRPDFHHQTGFALSLPIVEDA